MAFRMRVTSLMRSRITAGGRRGKQGTGMGKWQGARREGSQLRQGQSQHLNAPADRPRRTVLVRPGAPPPPAWGEDPAPGAEPPPEEPNGGGPPRPRVSSPAPPPP